MGTAKSMQSPHNKLLIGLMDSTSVCKVWVLNDMNVIHFTEAKLLFDLMYILLFSLFNEEREFCTFNVQYSTPQVC